MVFDFGIIGGGIVGLAIAKQILTTFPGSKIIIFEKEPGLGHHSSGRNSGVLHAGFYYSADSLKAKFTKDGNRLLTKYCLENELPYDPCGKLVVAREAKDLPQLDELYARGQKNQIELTWVDRAEAEAIEPKVRFFGDKALYSPTTASVCPQSILASLEKFILASGAKISFSDRFLDYNQTTNEIITTAGRHTCNYIINTAGAYADQVARKLGIEHEFTMIPFKGLYLVDSGNSLNLRTHIYPVPDLDMPFLGVHFTRTVAGKTKIGPTAYPSLSRENYHGVKGLKGREILSIGRGLLGIFMGKDNMYRRFAVKELPKFFAANLKSHASILVDSNQDLSHFSSWGKPGIRPQLMNKRTKKLEMDFVVRQGKKSIHVLNAISPALTCSFAMARHLVDKIGENV